MKEADDRLAAAGDSMQQHRIWHAEQMKEANLRLAAA
jgi:hypothetical protein